MSYDGNTNFSVNTLGIYDSSLYYSKSVMILNGKISEEKMNDELHLFSLTGGTNATVRMDLDMIIGNHINFTVKRLYRALRRKQHSLVQEKV